MFNSKLEKEIKKLKRLNKKRKEEIKDLKERIFRPKEKKSSDYSFFSQMLKSYWWGTSYTSISLEEKIDAIAKHLKIEFDTTDKKESEVIARKIRKPRKKRKKK